MNQPLTLHLPEDVLNQLAELAEERGVSVEAVAAELLVARSAAAQKKVMDVMDEVLDEFHELHQRLA